MAASETQQKRFIKQGWTGTAFIVEALILLVFVAGALAVLLNIFVESYVVGTRSQEEARAVLVASNAAERFAAAPTAGIFVSSEDDFVVSCVVEEEETAAGALYHAQISVFLLDDEDRDELKGRDYLVPLYFDAPEPIYELTTSRYVSGEVS